MNAFALLLLVGCIIGMFKLSRNWAPIPLLVGCCYTTMGQGLEIGFASLPIFRALLLAGLIRMFIKTEQPSGPLTRSDLGVITLVSWILIAGCFHDTSLGGGLVYSSGVAFNVAAVYLLIRGWCRDHEEAALLVRATAYLLAPVALAMAAEKIIGKNLFAVFGGIPSEVMVREGQLRAQGPFRHPILAGTVGASCLPWFVGIWKSHRSASIVGLVSASAITLFSSSSGPVMTALSGILALFIWKVRHMTLHLKIGACSLYLLAQIKTGEPGYYLMKRIDISGGSTGWHRARLIESAHEHLAEWWLIGTDVTRHWMPTGVSFSPHHTDITNYYLGFGVLAGLPAVVATIFIIAMNFRHVGRACSNDSQIRNEHQFFVWCMGAGLFAHAVTAVSVSYFDQSMVFFWMTIAVIASLSSGLMNPKNHEALGIASFKKPIS